MASKTVSQILGLEKSKPPVDEILDKLLLDFIDRTDLTAIRQSHGLHEEDVDVQSLFLLVDKTLVEATAIVDSIVNPKGIQGSESPKFEPPKDFNPPLAAIDEVACQITCKALDTNDVEKTVISLFLELSSYSWVTKAVIALSSLALSYGDFWRLAQSSTSDQLAQPMAMLKGLPAITRKSSDVKKVCENLNNMIKTILDMTRHIVDFERDSKNDSELSAIVNVQMGVYQTIISVLACSIQFTSLVRHRDNYKGKHLQAFLKKVNSIYSTIDGEFEEFKRKKETKIEEQRLLRIFKHPSSNVNLIKALLYTKSDPKPLVIGSKSDKQYSIEVLRQKKVMLLISDQKLSSYDIDILIKMYEEPEFKYEGYEIVWIIDLGGMDWTKELDDLRSKMPWYTVSSPTLINNQAIKILKKEWNLTSETTATVLNIDGKSLNNNAMTTIRLYKSAAIPLLDATVTQTHDINWFELLVTDKIFPQIQKAIDQKGSEQYFLLYRAEDHDTKEKIEALLKEKKRQEIEEPQEDGANQQIGEPQENGAIQQIEDQGGIPIVFHCVNNMPLFWSRLEILMQLILTMPINNKIDHMRDILQLYTNFKTERGFAVLTKGLQVVTSDSIVIVTEVLSQYETDWKKNVNVEGKTFDMAFMDFRNTVFKPPKCIKFFIPAEAYKPDSVDCPACESKMKKYVNFECCHEEH